MLRYKKPSVLMDLENEAKLGRQFYKETEKINEKWPKMAEKWPNKRRNKKRDEAPISIQNYAHFARKIF
jgi:hypothetical protein